MAKLQAAIIGCGGRGNEHAKGYAASEAVVVFLTQGRNFAVIGWILPALAFLIGGKNGWRYSLGASSLLSFIFATTLVGSPWKLNTLHPYYYSFLLLWLMEGLCIGLAMGLIRWFYGLKHQ